MLKAISEIYSREVINLNMKQNTRKIVQNENYQKMEFEYIFVMKSESQWDFNPCS